MPGDVFYSVENMRLGVGEMKAFLVDVLGGEPRERFSSRLFFVFHTF